MHYIVKSNFYTTKDREKNIDMDIGHQTEKVLSPLPSIQGCLTLYNNKPINTFHIKYRMTKTADTFCWVQINRGCVIWWTGVEKFLNSEARRGGHKLSRVILFGAIFRISTPLFENFINIQLILIETQWSSSYEALMCNSYDLHKSDWAVSLIPNFLIFFFSLII